jgi:putative peptidoglycan lipid II flippase
VAAVTLALGAVAGLLLLGRLVIRILFERGAFDDAAGDLTYRVLVVYAVALPAYIATEVITRGLIALRDTRTPLLTNSGQLIGRIVLIAVLLRPWRRRHPGRLRPDQHTGDAGPGRGAVAQARPARPPRPAAV